MPAPKVNISDIRRGVRRYNAGDRPWRQTLNRVDWFIAFENELYPLKYTYALAVDLPPIQYTTDQMKGAMRHLGLSFYSLKAELDTNEVFEERVRNSLRDPSGRARRLRNAVAILSVKYVTSLSFDRNPDVVAEVLSRAKGLCESCGKPAPFLRASDNSPYLEVHHKVFLANDGEDTVANAEALCPNCHRQKHHG